MKKLSIIFLKAGVIVVGLIGLVICIFGVPAISKGVPSEYPQIPYFTYQIITGIYFIAIPFFIGLYKVWKFLNHISKNTAFGDTVIVLLKDIKHCTFTVGVLCAGFLPLAHAVAQSEDAPGIVVILLFLTAIPFTIAAIADIIQKLVVVNLKNN